MSLNPCGISTRMLPTEVSMRDSAFRPACPMNSAVMLPAPELALTPPQSPLSWMLPPPVSARTSPLADASGCHLRRFQHWLHRPHRQSQDRRHRFRRVASHRSCGSRWRRRRSRLEHFARRNRSRYFPRRFARSARRWPCGRGCRRRRSRCEGRRRWCRYRSCRHRW